MRYYIFSGLAAMIVLTTSCTGNRNRGNIVDQTFVHKYGVEVPPEYWTSCGKDGAVVTTTTDGVKVSKYYAAGILDGETTYTYPHTETIHRKHIYAKGKLIKEIDYYYDGTPRMEVAHDHSSNLRNVSIWYTTGSPKSQETYEGSRLLSGEYYTYSNQKDASVDNFGGIRVNRDDYGQLLSQDTIQEGQRVMETTYHSNGAPKEMVAHKDGAIHGIKKIFHPGGEPNVMEEWVNGIQEGVTTVFLNGEKYAEVPYTKGCKEGIEKHFKDGSIVVEEIGWSNGKLHGPTIAYVGGEAVKTEWYYEGEPVTKVNFDRLSARHHTY